MDAMNFTQSTVKCLLTGCTSRVCTLVVSINDDRPTCNYCTYSTVCSSLLSYSRFYYSCNTVLFTFQNFNLHSTVHYHHRHHRQSLHREGRWGTTDDFATSFIHFSLFSTALCDLPNSRPVHSLMLSSYLFPCPPCLLPPFTVPCKMVLAEPDEQET